MVIFNYVTDLKLNDYKIETIISMGRRRLKIENEGFNEQKMEHFVSLIYVVKMKNL